MIKVAICDDEEQICNKLNAMVKKFFENINRPVWVAEYNSGRSLLKSNIRFDIILLDIEMPDMNGIDTAINLRKWDVNSKIIYISNYSEFKGSAYKVHAFDYIEKPICELSIFSVFQEAVRYLDNTTEKKEYAFKTIEGIVVLEIDDIYYFEYMSRKVIINSAKGKYIANYSLKQLYDEFNKSGFESPHKSFIINMLYIKYIKGFDVFMENGDTIPLAQKRAVEFKTKFNSFLQDTFDKI